MYINIILGIHTTQRMGRLLQQCFVYNICDQRQFISIVSALTKFYKKILVPGIYGCLVFFFFLTCDFKLPIFVTISHLIQFHILFLITLSSNITLASRYPYKNFSLKLCDRNIAMTSYFTITK